MPQHAVDNPPIPMVPTYTEDEIEKVIVTNRYNAGTDANPDMAKVTLQLPAADRTNVELVIYVINEFVDAVADERLHLNTGAMKFAKF